VESIDSVFSILCLVKSEFVRKMRNFSKLTTLQVVVAAMCSAVVREANLDAVAHSCDTWLSS
jgi:hypothetical protein